MWDDLFSLFTLWLFWEKKSDVQWNLFLLWEVSSIPELVLQKPCVLGRVPDHPMMLFLSPNSSYTHTPTSSQPSCIFSLKLFSAWIMPDSLTSPQHSYHIQEDDFMRDSAHFTYCTCKCIFFHKSAQHINKQNYNSLYFSFTT